MPPDRGDQCPLIEVISAPWGQYVPIRAVLYNRPSRIVQVLKVQGAREDSNVAVVGDICNVLESMTVGDGAAG